MVGHGGHGMCFLSLRSFEHLKGFSNAEQLYLLVSTVVPCVIATERPWTFPLGAVEQLNSMPSEIIHDSDFITMVFPSFLLYFFTDWMRMVLLPYKIQDHSADNITCLQSMSISCSSGRHPHLDWYVLIWYTDVFFGYFHVFPKIGSQIIPNFTILALKAVGFGYPHGRTPHLNRASWSFGKPPSLGPCWAASSADKAADIPQICLENWDLASGLW